MPRRALDQSVYDAALERLIALFEAGHRLVFSFSAGKDSGVCVELGILAATLTGRLPIDVIMRDEEIMFPGTFEYAERMAARPEVAFHWIYACQPVINLFNREQPYFWVFDPLLPPEQWVRSPPEMAYRIPELHIGGMTTLQRFPPAPGKMLVSVIGLRTSESMTRNLSIQSAKGHLTKPNAWGVHHCRPIYDWLDADVWKAIYDHSWDYNRAYDTMHRLGVPRDRLRIAPPTMAAAGLDQLHLAAQAWPQWFARVCKRLPGVRSAAMFGKRAVTPHRRLGETWEACFQRECVEHAPVWIADRARAIMERKLHEHRLHSTDPFPQIDPCPKCKMISSWKGLAQLTYMGDAFSQKLPRTSGSVDAVGRRLLCLVRIVIWRLYPVRGLHRVQNASPRKAQRQSPRRRNMRRWGLVAACAN